MVDLFWKEHPVWGKTEEARETYRNTYPGTPIVNAEAALKGQPATPLQEKLDDLLTRELAEYADTLAEEDTQELRKFLEPIKQYFEDRIYRDPESNPEGHLTSTINDIIRECHSSKPAPFPVKDVELHENNIVRVAAKLFNDGIDPDKFDRQRANEILSETVMPVFCKRILATYEPEIISIMKTFERRD